MRPGFRSSASRNSRTPTCFGHPEFLVQRRRGRRGPRARRRRLADWSSPRTGSSKRACRSPPTASAQRSARSSSPTNGPSQRVQFRRADPPPPGDRIHARRHGGRDHGGQEHDLSRRLGDRPGHRSQGRPCARERDQAACSEMAGRVLDKAVQIFGGRGYMRENPVERLEPRRARRPDLGRHVGDPADDHRRPARQARTGPFHRLVSSRAERNPASRDFTRPPPTRNPRRGTHAMDLIKLIALPPPLRRARRDVRRPAGLSPRRSSSPRPRRSTARRARPSASSTSTIRSPSRSPDAMRRRSCSASSSPMPPVLPFAARCTRRCATKPAG